MKIINPIYDYAFKYLMQNNRIAKKVLSTLLECEVVELMIEQQEVITVDESRGFKLYRLDFSAIIINEEGQKQKVLIELQKSKLPTNLIRFRSYLGESYTKKEVVINALGEEENKVYPIISIYILGYNVVDIPYLAVNIDNKITNAVTKKEVNVASDFINLLTHKTRIIQVRRLKTVHKSRLERFLLLFNQAWITTDKFILELEEIPEEFTDIVNYLRGPVQDEAFRKKLRGEEEIDDIFRNQEAQLLRQKEALLVAKHNEEMAKQNEEMAKQRVEAAKHNEAVAKHNEEMAKQRVEAAKHNEAIAKQNEEMAKQRVEAAKQNEEMAKQQAQAMQIKFARHLLQQQTPIEEIVRLTGLEAAVIRRL